MMQTHGKITKEALQDLESRIGVTIENPPQPYIEAATKDTIRHFANGMGDGNPLYLDSDYASKTKYEGIIAPPCILYATDRIVSGYVGGLPGVHALFSGTDWEWFLPIRENDRISATSRLKKIEEKNSQFAKKAIKQTYEVTFRNQFDEVVAIADSWCFRTERDTAKNEGKYRAIEMQKWTQEELMSIYKEYDKEEIRGAKTRYWEDVEINDELPPVIKGPLTVTSFIAWDQGWGGLYIKGHRQARDMFMNHPALGIPNSQGILDVPERVHWEEEMAKNIGAPGPYDYGPERVTWLSHLMTNWIGDDGFLKRLYAEVRRFNVIGDVTWCKGKVVGKYIQGNDHLVECEVWGENQRGEITAKGKATVILPTKK